MDSLWGSFPDSKGGAFLKQKKLVTVVIGHLETSRSWGQVYLFCVFPGCVQVRSLLLSKSKFIPNIAYLFRQFDYDVEISKKQMKPLDG